MNEKRLLANRQNALRSTGPRTETGKARSRLNATRHGGFARVNIETDDRNRLNVIYLDLLAEFNPEGFEEKLLVQDIAEILLRIGWFRAGEVQAMQQYRFLDYGRGEEKGDWGTALVQDAGAYGAIPRCLAAEEILDRRLWRYFDRLQKLQARRKNSTF